MYTKVTTCMGVVASWNILASFLGSSGGESSLLRSCKSLGTKLNIHVVYGTINYNSYPSNIHTFIHYTALW